jgi:hypothetical protein
MQAPADAGAALPEAAELSLRAAWQREAMPGSCTRKSINAAIFLMGLKMSRLKMSA